MKTTIHCCLSVRGAIANLSRSRAKYAAGFRRSDGSRATRAEIIDGLMDHLAQGHEVIPFGDPCEGFDYKTGCPRHPEETA